MGTHPIFESDFDCLTGCQMDLDFSTDESSSSLSIADDDNPIAGRVDDLDSDLFGGLNKAPVSTSAEKKKGVTFDINTKQQPANKSLDDFLDEFDDKDPLAGLLSDSERQASDTDTFDFAPKKTQPFPKPSSSTSAPDKTKQTPPVTSSADLGGATGLSFSDEDDSLLDFKPQQQKQQKPKQQEVQKTTHPQKIDSAAGLGLGFTDDEESEFTFSEAIKTNPNRTISPVFEEKKRDDQDWLQGFLGTNDAQQMTPPQPAPEPKVKLTEKQQTPQPQQQPPVQAPVVKHIEAPIIQPPVTPAPVAQVQAPSAALSIDSNRLHLIERQRDDAERRLSTAQCDLAQAEARLRTVDSDNVEHVARLKRIHVESVQIIRAEFDVQLCRIKTIHRDEMDALKQAFGATSDVKDILVKVDNASASLVTIVQQLASRPSTHGELTIELNKHQNAIKLERKQFEAERERMVSLVNQMDVANREQRQLSENENFRLQAEIQRIETERRLLEDERRKLMAEVARKTEENLKFKNALLEGQSRQVVEMGKQRQEIAAGWSELERAKSSLFELVKPEAFMKHEENIRQAAAAQAESRVMKRELDFKLEQLNERRAELKQEVEMVKGERADVTRHKDQLKRDEERLRAKYADFLSDTAEGRTALEAAKRIESRLDEKRQTVEHAFETLKNERLLLRQERQAVHTLQVTHQPNMNNSGHVQQSFNELFPPILGPMSDFSDDHVMQSIPPLPLSLTF